jgi:hypothetical protein
MSTAKVMSDANPIERPHALSYTAVAALLVIMIAASGPLCWVASNRYGVDKSTASNAGWIVFNLFYTLMLVLPWLNLKGLEHLNRAQRLEKMCVVWLYLTVAPHLLIELPWVAFYDAIMAGKGQLWAYAWWSYFDGGDARYVTRDVNLVAMETGASIIGILGAVILVQRHRRGTFSDTQLLILMAMMVGDFYPTYMYLATEIYRGFPNVGGVADLLVKFLGANVYWVIMPWVFFIWAGRQLIDRRAR